MIRTTLVALCLLLVSACSTDKTAGTPAFDRRPLLENAADNFLVPAYQNLAIAADSQQAAVARLVAAPSEATLGSARHAFRVAFMAAQRIQFSEFGPADLGNIGMLWANICTFPAAAASIEASIANGQDAVVNSRYKEQRGLGAIDYLLFSDSAQTAGRFAAQPARCRYLATVAQDIAAKSRQAADAWPAYRAAFVSASGTETGSGTSDYYNAMVLGYEVVKNLKVGVPAGQMAGQSGPEPAKTEAHYSGLNRQAVAANLDLFNQLYTGSTGDRDGPGWDDYLATLPGGPDLVAATHAQFAAIQAAQAALQAGKTLAGLAAAQAPELTRLNAELQKFTRFVKSDMSSLLGIAITFSSGDGD